MPQRKLVSFNGKSYDVGGMSNVEASRYLHVVADNTELVQRYIGVATVRALETIGLLAEGHAKRELSKPKPHRSKPTPRPNVDTGRLRNSVTHQIFPEQGCVVVGTNVEYAPDVEFGTSRSPAYPFLQPAASGHGEEYREVIRESLRNA